jgi:hypothetical protein
MTGSSIQGGYRRESVDFSRRATAAVVAALTAAAVAAQVISAHAARADQTVSANDVCAHYIYGLVAKVSLTRPEAICVDRLNFTPGLLYQQNYLIPGEFPGLPAGSYRVNPLDLLSDWVIPGV